MTALPVITDVFRVAFNWVESGTGQTAENVMHFHKVGAVSATVAASIDAAPNGDMFASMPSTVHCDTCSITPLDGITGTTDHVLTNWNGSGTAGEFMPAVAAEIKLTTAKRGRSYRGRVFLPFTRETAQSNGSLTGAVTALMNGADGWQDFVDDLTVASCPLVVASYLLSTAEDVTTAVAQTAVRTQRRRQARLF